MKWQRWGEPTTQAEDGTEYLALDQKGAFHLATAQVYAGAGVEFVVDEDGGTVDPVWICQTGNIPLPFLAR